MVAQRFLVPLVGVRIPTGLPLFPKYSGSITAYKKKGLIFKGIESRRRWRWCSRNSWFILIKIISRRRAPKTSPSGTSSPSVLDSTGSVGVSKGSNAGGAEFSKGSLPGESPKGSGEERVVELFQKKDLGGLGYPPLWDSVKIQTDCQELRQEEFWVIQSQPSANPQMDQKSEVVEVVEVVGHHLQPRVVS